jgi:uncharacterized protein YodC (DUF2158 family)
MSEQFKAGDVVQLKSGGPVMTVNKTGNKSMGGPFTVWCSWFEGEKKMNDDFPPESLKLSDRHQNKERLK